MNTLFAETSFRKGQGCGKWLNVRLLAVMTEVHLGDTWLQQKKPLRFLGAAFDCTLAADPAGPLHYEELLHSYCKSTIVHCQTSTPALHFTRKKVYNHSGALSKKSQKTPRGTEAPRGLLGCCLFALRQIVGNVERVGHVHSRSAAILRSPETGQ